MTTFNGGILNIPGLVPVNIGSSNPYPVPFAPQIKPPQSTPFGAVGAPTGQGQGAGPGFGTNEGGSSYSGVDQYTPTFGSTTADPSFVDFPGYGGSGGYGSYSNYSPQINPAQSTSFGGGLSAGLGNYGQSVWDRINSIGDAPHISGDNIAQAGINAAGLFSPIASGLAGLLQGFNILDPGETTGNAAADLAMTPGVVQSGVANAANWLNRQFGGTYMPSSYVDPNMAGPPTADGSPYDGAGKYVPPNASGPSNSQYSGIPLATLQSLSAYGTGYDTNNPWGYDPQAAAANAAMSHTKLGDVGGSGNGTADGMPADPFNMQGNFLNTFMMGAGFGGVGYGYGDMGLGSSSNPLTEGGWSSPGFGAVDRHANPNDTN